MKKIIMMMICMLMWSHTGMAACIATIPASTPTANFTVNGDATVTDLKTGLIWKQCSEGQSGVGCATGVVTSYTWQGALQAASALNVAGGFAGFTDWRVPNIKELASIVERQCAFPAINAIIFPATLSTYWVSSPYAGFPSQAWTVDFSFGGDLIKVPSNAYYVRLVRGGQ